MFSLIQMGYCFQLLIPMWLCILGPHFLVWLPPPSLSPGARKGFCYYHEVALQFSLGFYLRVKTLKTLKPKPTETPSTLLLPLPTPHTPWIVFYFWRIFPSLRGKQGTAISYHGQNSHNLGNETWVVFFFPSGSDATGVNLSLFWKCCPGDCYK